MQYARTLERGKAILEEGFELIECWEQDFNESRISPKNETETIPHAIGSTSRHWWTRANARRKNCCSKASTCRCLFLSVDIPKRDPEHISSKDREELIRKFLGGACTIGCGHPRRHAAVHPGGLRFPVRESASADQPMVFPDPSSRFQLRTL